MGKTFIGDRDREEFDARSLHSLERLTDAYMELAETVPVEDITVRMLCQQSRVNRSTFYRYFEGIDAFRAHVAEVVFGRIFGIMKGYTDYSKRECCCRKALELTYHYRNLLKQLLDATTHSIDVVKLLYNNLTPVKQAIEMYRLGEDMTQMMYTMSCSTIASIWMTWISTDFALPIDEMVTLTLATMSSQFALLQHYPEQIPTTIDMPLGHPQVGLSIPPRERGRMQEAAQAGREADGKGFRNRKSRSA